MNDLGCGAHREAHGVDLVGRDAELAALREALDAAAQGSGGLVLITGEPGIGKSSLVERFGAEVAAVGATVLWGAGWEDGGAPAYWPWVQVLRGAARAGAEGTVTALSGDLGPLAPAGPSSPAPDRFLMFDAVARVLSSLAERAPVVVVLDDLHVAGAASALLLDFLARHHRHTALLLVATYRSAEAAMQPALAEVLGRLEPIARVLSLAPLSAEQVRLMLTAHAVTADEHLVAQVVDRTQGNPLFVRHVARHLAAGHPPAAAGLPLGLRNALRRQAELLTAESGLPDCLPAAAVVGMDLTLPVLAAVVGAEPASLRPLLDAAEAAGLLHGDPLDPTHYQFTHALVREALQDSLTVPARAELHLRAARALEARGAAPSRLAHHYSEAWPAGGTTEAVAYCRRAGQDATAALAHAEAADWFQRALTALGRSADASPAERCELLLSLARAQTRAGQIPEGRASAELAARVADALDDPVLLSRSALLVAEHLPFNAVDRGAVELLTRADRRWGGRDSALRAEVLARLATAAIHLDRTAAHEHARRSEAVAGNDDAAVAVALSAQLYVDWGRHQPQEALSTARRIAALATDEATAVEAALWVLVFTLELGDLAAADEAVREVERIADRSRQPALQHLARSRRAMLSILRGDAGTGLEQAHRAHDLARRAGIPDADAVLWGQLYAVWRVGGLSPEDAAEMERIAVFLTESSPLRVAHEAAVIRMLVARGERTAATERFDRIVADLDGLDRDMVYVWTLALLADDCVALERRDAAAVIYQALLPFADRFVVAAGAVVCIGSASHQLGLLVGLLGRTGDARAHLQRAVAAHRAAGCAALLAASELAADALADTTVTVALEGDVATVQYGRTVVRLPRSLGLSYLAVLVANPGTEIAAARLVAMGSGATAPAARHTDAPATPTRAADDVLDRTALTAYRQRLVELEAELGEARDWNDPARVDALEWEREFVLAELAGSLGLGGRPRRFTDEAERARVNVTRAIRSAIRKIGDQQPDLGRHLDACITTGARCCYNASVGVAARRL